MKALRILDSAESPLVLSQGGTRGGTISPLTFAPRPTFFLSPTCATGSLAIHCEARKEKS